MNSKIWVFGVLVSSILFLTSCASKPHLVQQTKREQMALLNVELGLGYLEQGQRARAKTKLTQALAFCPNLPETKGAMAYFRELVGDHIEADQLYREAIQIATNKGAVYNNYGAYLCRQTRYPEADSAFLEALKDKNYARTAEVYENAGLCVLKSSSTGDTQLQKKAEDYFKQALLHDPGRGAAKEALITLTRRYRATLSQIGRGDGRRKVENRNIS